MFFTAYFLYLYYFLLKYKTEFNNKRIEILDKMLDFAEIEGNEIILDLGAGSGILSIGFAKKLIDGGVYGIDIYENNLIKQIINSFKNNFFGNSKKNAEKNAKCENVSDKCKFISHDLSKGIKFPNDYFDVVISSQSLPYISANDKLNFFEEIERIIKKNGRIIFFESTVLRKFQWDIKDINEYFVNNNYLTNIIKINSFNNTCIFYAKKIV